MTDLAAVHAEYDKEFMRQLEQELAAMQPGAFTLTAGAQAYFAESERRSKFVEDRLRERLIDLFRDDLEIRAPGPLATSTAKALVGVVTRMLGDKSLTSEIPMDTSTKIEM